MGLILHKTQDQSAHSFISLQINQALLKKEKWNTCSNNTELQDVCVGNFMILTLVKQSGSASMKFKWVKFFEHETLSSFAIY